MAGLNAAKCPSCKIVLLRTVQGSTLMQCPACGAKYHSKGSSGPQEFAEDNYLLTDRERGLQEKTATRKHTTRRHSFHHCREGSGDSSSGLPPMKLLGTRSNHQRGASLQISITSPPDLKSRAQKICNNPSNSEKLHLPEIKDATTCEMERSKLGRLKKFFSSSMWSRKSSPHSNCSSASSGRELELPLVVQRSSTEESGGSECSLFGTGERIRKPHLTSATVLGQDFMAAKESTNYEYLQEVLVNTFNSWEEICNSFKPSVSLTYKSHITLSCLGAQLQDKCVLRSRSGWPLLSIDMDFVHCVYSVQMELPHNVQRAILKAIVTGLLKESKNHTCRELEGNEDYLRVHLILIENPQFYCTNTYIVFAQLLKQMSQLPDNAHWCLVHWLRTYRIEWFRDIIAKIQQFISVRLFPPNPSDLPTNSKCAWWIPSATKVLALLYKANSLEYPPVVPYTEFYNSTLDHIDLMSEFYAWQSPQGHATTRFSFCQYPFVLSMSAKKTILQRDSEHQMLIMANKSLAEKVQQNQTPQANTLFLSLNVRRTHLVKDSINELMQKQQDLKKKLKVKFAGEPGLDMGGLTKEWFLLLVRNIFQPEYGLFTYNRESGYYWFNTGLEDCEDEYGFVGVLMGLAVYNSIILDIHFPPCCYKKLLSPAIMPRRGSTPVGMLPDLGLHDLIQAMPHLGRGLKALLEYEGNVEEDLCHTFQVSYERVGPTVTTELLPDGNSILVTSENREQFVSLYVNHLLNESIEEQFTAFYYGFHSVSDSNALTLFHPEEIEMLVCGCPEFNMHALESVTVYDEYDQTDTTIRNFWEVVHGFSTEQQRQLLLFVTGSNRVPVGGLSDMHFKISRLPFPSPTRTNMLPMAHTCFNHLLLPPYKTRKRLKEKLTIAINNAEGFGIE